MDNDHGITDELRDDVFYAPMKPDQRGRFNAIIDRIDSAHESEIGRAAQLLADAEKDRDLNYANWQDCKQKVLQHNITMDELSAEIERLKDELAHNIELPKDADGEYIHIGDVVVGKEDGEEDFIFEVYEIAFFPDGSCSVRAANDFGFDPWQLHHHKQPTVEDVLDEFVERWHDTHHDDIPALKAEYAAKLQLKED